MEGEYEQTCLQHGCKRTFSYDTKSLPKLSSLIRKSPTGGGTLHLATHIGHILLDNNLATADEILGDYGLVHELVHFQDFGPSVTGCAASIESLAEFADELQARLSDV